MNEEKAIRLIKLAIKETKSDDYNCALKNDTDLLEDDILDSIESYIFPRKLEIISSISMPEGDDITKDLYKVSTLIDYLIKNDI